LEFKYWNLNIILQLLESLYLQRSCCFSYWSRCFSCYWSYFSAAGAAFSVSASLSEPLSESPSTIAAVTKDKILSIDLEASF
jgi:hypothetical protein